MKHLTKPPLFFFLSSVLILQIASLQAQPIGSPIWMNEGVFGQYEFKSSGIVFQNRTLIPFEPDASATWRWECSGLDNDLATLNISLNFNAENRTLLFVKEVYVNTTSRQVFLSNGTLIGTTHLWAKANPVNGEEIVVWDAPPDKIVGVVENEGLWHNTPQGGQKIYKIGGTGTINGVNTYIRTIHDVDTGIMISGIIDDEATLLALDIQSLLVNGEFSFTNTNIDLGPKELMPEILAVLPIVIVVIVFISVFVIFYYRRKKRRRH